MMPDAWQLGFAVAIGFAVAAMLATGYQALTCEAPTFRLLERGPQSSTFAAVPFLVFAAPFIIMRDAAGLYRAAGESLVVALAATTLAGIWSLMSGWGVLLAVAMLLPR